MKKKTWILIIVLLAVLFIPIPRGTYKDGGTKEYTAAAYKIVKWNKLTDDGIYKKTRVYFGLNRFKSIDALWYMEERKIDHSVLEHTFTATVLEINGESILVEPLEGENERRSGDKISFGIDTNIGAKVGSVVKVTYVGGVMESYPAQINAVKWELIKDLRDTKYPKYTGEWLNKETAERLPNDSSVDLVITEIYSDCFFAEPVIPMPYTIKINGNLDDEWCPGDQVLVTYNNTYNDIENHRMEANMISVEKSTFKLEPGVDYKPVIYLYPQTETEVSVKLALDGRFTCTYPEYNDGWKVTASPDGTLTDGKGQKYNYLYWEGETNAKWDMNRGFCVKGEDTAAFLEKALSKLGLNRREANEFIVYWLPLMQENPYNIISFQTDVYNDSAKLNITPKPDTLIRVFMAFKPSDTYVNIDTQDLTAPERKGFTVVEWGGAVVR